MKQTAVEKLGIAFRQWQTDWDNFDKTGKNKPASYDEFIVPFLEMEKEQIGYTKEDILLAGKLGEINHYDTKHIVSWIDEAKEINKKNIDKVLKIY
jgi:hypothetical protein